MNALLSVRRKYSAGTEAIKTDTICFTVVGDPFGKQRPRHNRYTNTTYTPYETQWHEKQIALEYKKQCGNVRFPSGAYVELRVTAYMKIPKSTSKAARTKMIDGLIRPTVKPDIDNIWKLVADALNGIAYEDDKCIVDAQVQKFYSEQPRTEIVLIGRN